MFVHAARGALPVRVRVERPGRAHSPLPNAMHCCSRPCVTTDRDCQPFYPQLRGASGTSKTCTTTDAQRAIHTPSLTRKEQRWVRVVSWLGEHVVAAYFHAARSMDKSVNRHLRLVPQRNVREGTKVGLPLFDLPPIHPSHWQHMNHGARQRVDRRSLLKVQIQTPVALRDVKVTDAHLAIFRTTQRLREPVRCGLGVGAEWQPATQDQRKALVALLQPFQA